MICVINSVLLSFPRIAPIAQGHHQPIYTNPVKSGKKPGGQPGHKGHTLAFCTDEPDEEIFHSPDTCSSCGGSLKEVEAEQGEVHQVIDISVPSKVIINHHSMIKRCSCGKCNKGTFPSGVKGMVNYGPAISALIANLSVCQYVSCARVAGFIEDLYKIHMSSATVSNILGRFAKNCKNNIEQIKENLYLSEVVNSDETGNKVNGAKWWMHTYQNDLFTFIGAHPSRGAGCPTRILSIWFPKQCIGA